MRAAVLILLFCFVAYSTGRELPKICPNIISRQEWGASTAIQVEYSLVPVEYVIIHHTVTPRCMTREKCTEAIANIQNFHMNELEFHDIGYNFVIGGDGNVYEGAGWHRVGAHTRGYNTRSIGIGLVGNFETELPTNKQMQATKDLLECGLQLGELDSRFKLLGGRQVSITKSPGLRMYREIQTWSHYTKIH